MLKINKNYNQNKIKTLNLYENIIARTGYGAGLVAFVMQIGAFIVNYRYDICIRNKAEMYAFAHSLSDPNPTERLGLEAPHFCIADIMSLISSKEAHKPSLIHVDSTIKERLWLELHEILVDLSAQKEKLGIAKEDIDIIQNHFDRISKEDDFDFFADKLSIKEAADRIKNALTQTIQISISIAQKARHLSQITNALSKNKVYGSLQFITEAYSRTIEGQKQLKHTNNNSHHFKYKAIQWAIMREHKNNSEEVPKMNILRKRGFIFQAIASILFILSLSFLCISLHYINRLKWKLVNSQISADLKK